MNDNDKRNNVAFANTSFSRVATPSDVLSTFASRRSAARVVAAVVSTGLLVGMGAVGVGPALAAPAPDPTDCNDENTVTAPAPAADIQALLDSNTPTVCLSGTFTFANPLTFNHDLTLIGLTDSTALDGDGDTRILVGTGNTSLIASNLEFRGGLAALRFDAITGEIFDEGRGGAILTEGQAAIFGSEFFSNLGGKGGGAISATGAVRVTESTFVNNRVNNTFDGFSPATGGAVSARGDVTVVNSRFSENEARGLHGGAGGAIGTDADVFVVNSTFTDNESEGDGGAIFAVNYVGGVTPSTGSTFTGNSAPGLGGAIYAITAISVNGYTFSGNTAADGGALYSGSTVNTLNSTFFANIATGEGGAIYTRDGSVAFSTFFNNQAAPFIMGTTPDIPGQAVYLEASRGSVLPIEGSIFMGRLDESQLGVGGGTASTFNNVGGNIFSTASDQEPNLPAALPAAASTLFAQSALALFGTTTPVLAPNRGTTQTLALVSGSPAIDAAQTSSGVPSDQRGLLRPGLGSTLADAGAFEFQAATPGQVNGLTATRGNSSVALSWSAASNDGDSPITDYVIERNSGSGWVQVVDGISTATSFTVTGLANGTSYQFRVSALNAVGSGVVSVASASVIPAGIPGQVVGLSGTPGNGSVALSWSAPSSTGGSAVTDYVIEQNSGSGWVRVVDGVSTATSFTVTGLANGTSYQFRVSAVNAVGSGVVSAASASVIPAAGVAPPGSGVTSPAAPTTTAVLGVTGSSPAAVWLAGGAALLMAFGSALVIVKRRRFR